MAEFYLRAATSAIFTLAGGMKSSGAMNKPMSEFGYPLYFAQVLGLGELVMAAANVGAELAPLVGAAPQPFVAANVWIQRLSALILGGAINQHVIAGDGGFALPMLSLAMVAAVPALNGGAASPLESVGIAAALAAVGYGIVGLIARKPAAAAAAEASKTK